MATTALATSFKAELLNGAHVFDAPDSITATAASGSTAVTSVSSMVGIAVGMGVSGTGIAAGTVVAATSGTGFTLSVATTATITAGTLTLTADTFKMALIIASPTLSGGYNAAMTNYGTGSGTPTNANIGTDEVSGTGYTAGGVTLTNVSAVTSGTTAYITFGANPTWTSATFSCSAAVIYNTSARLSGVTNRVVAVFDLGGQQSVSGGTLTLVLPTASSTTALVRLT